MGKKTDYVDFNNFLNVLLKKDYEINYFFPFFGVFYMANGGYGEGMFV